MPTNSAEGIRWDLSDLFATYDDPRIETSLEECRARAERFAARFRGKIAGLAAKELLEGFKELEGIEDALGRVA
ncbi:MAG TPA: oligoendopeptidase, partial [Candidatus Binatia bacterium]